ncbi:MAG: surface antigen protein [Gemmatimonadetes bacterium]|nr:surface antigen protein [Gemmatimonadota bacterium]
MLGALGVLAGGCFGGGSDTTSGGYGASDTPPGYPRDHVDAGPGFTPNDHQKGPLPSFPNVHQADAPPPISGGTLLVTADGDHVVAADPDRDQIYVASLATRSLLKTLTLDAHDEPGRVAEDDAHRVHVALRRGGAIVTVDPVAGTILARRAVCPSPRGIALDVAAARMIVACEGGELFGVPTDPTGAPALIARLDRDLRDVVVTGDHVYVSRFRSAEILDVSSSTGAVLSRSKPDVSEVDKDAKPTLAWRMIAAPPSDPSSKPIVAHEVAGTPGGAPVKTTQGGYGGGGFSPTDCQPSILSSAISHGDAPLVRAPTQLVLPVDFVTDGAAYAVVAAGNAHTAQLPQVFVLSSVGGPCATTGQMLAPHGETIAIALLPDHNVVVQSREPAQLEILSIETGLSGDVIALSADSRSDTGHAIFHANSGAGIACASCHGEGGDDGHVWTFDQEGSRRTPSLRATLEGTAPYHWNGEMTDISMLSDSVMTGRMNGPALDSKQKDNLQSWLFALPALPAPTGLDAAAVARGQVLFASGATGCASCHSGPRFTSSITVDVGTGDRFQVPSLIGVGARAPFLHDGCAPTLTDRFGACGGGAKHGDTSGLSTGDIADLVAYLQTL